MAGGVNVKMGVTGVSQFKANIDKAKTSLKTLDAQLALTEKQYKASGDAETYMQQKTEQLQAKLETQKQIAAQAEDALRKMTENGVDKSSKAFQGMLQTLTKAKADILDTETAIDSVGTAADETSDNVSEMNSQLANIGQGISWQNVTEGLGTISAGIGKAITKAWQLGEALVNATLGAGSWADELGETAEKYEDTLKAFGGGDSATEALQRMRKTARLIDTDVDTILTAQDKLSKNREGKGKEFMGALAYLGIDPDGMSDLDLFWKAGQAIAKLGDEEDKVSYANQLFGKSWRELMPMFKAGRTEYEKTYNSWNVVEDDQIDALGKMDDQYVKMTEAWETFKMEMLSAFSGPLTEGMKAITGLFEELNKYLDSKEGQAMLKQLGETISGLITDLTEINPADVVGGIKTVIEDIVKAFEWIDKHHDDVVTGLTAIAGGFALIKITTLAANIGKFVSGVKGLVGGGTPTTTTGTGTATGGWMTGAWNKMTAATANASSVIQTAGGLMPVLFDRILNETNFGRAIRDGGSIWEGLTQDVEEARAGIQHNAEIFGEDWNNNVLTQLGKNNIRYWNDRASEWQLMDENTHGDDWSIADALADASGKMEEAAEEMTGGSDSTRQSNSEMTQAASGMKGLPAETAEAVRQALNGAQVRIDGGLLSSYVGEVFAQWVANGGGTQ